MELQTTTSATRCSGEVPSSCYQRFQLSTSSGTAVIGTFLGRFTCHEAPLSCSRTISGIPSPLAAGQNVSLASLPQIAPAASSRQLPSSDRPIHYSYPLPIVSSTWKALPTSCFSSHHLNLHSLFEALPPPESIPWSQQPFYLRPGSGDLPMLLPLSPLRISGNEVLRDRKLAQSSLSCYYECSP